MRSVLRFAVLVGATLVCTSRPAIGSTITWQYQGHLTVPLFGDFVAGTPVTLSWTFTAPPQDGCPQPGQAIYTENSLVLTIGGLTYHSGGALDYGVVFFPGCGYTFDPAPPALYMTNWSGPSLPAGELLWRDPWGDNEGTPQSFIPLDRGGAFPSDQPLSLFLKGPGFRTAGSTGPPTFLNASLQAVPEPASLLLLGTGLAAVVAARRRFTKRT